MDNLGKMNFAPPTIKVPNSELERLQLQQALGIGMIANETGAVGQFQHRAHFMETRSLDRPADLCVLGHHGPGDIHDQRNADAGDHENETPAPFL